MIITSGRSIVYVIRNNHQENCGFLPPKPFTFFLIKYIVPNFLNT